MMVLVNDVIICRSCGESKQLSEFYKNNRSTCKDCRRAYVAKWYDSNRDYAKERQRDYALRREAAPEGYTKRRNTVRKYHSKPEVRVKDLAYAKQRQAERQELLNNLKSRPCADCGQSFPPYVMDFDHVRGEKFMDLSNMKSFLLARILEEAAKCDIVCANCHRIRTHERRHNPASEVA